MIASLWLLVAGLSGCHDSVERLPPPQAVPQALLADCELDTPYAPAQARCTAELQWSSPPAHEAEDVVISWEFEARPAVVGAAVRHLFEGPGEHLVRVSAHLPATGDRLRAAEPVTVLEWPAPGPTPVIHPPPLDDPPRDPTPPVTATLDRTHLCPGAEVKVCYTLEDRDAGAFRDLELALWAVRGEDAASVDPADTANAFELGRRSVERAYPGQVVEGCLQGPLPRDVEGERFRVFLQLGADLLRLERPVEVMYCTPSSVDLVSCDLTVEGARDGEGPLTVSTCVCNRGRMRAGPHEVGLVVSPTPDPVDAEALEIGRCHVPELPAQECTTCRVALGVPDEAEGRLHVCARLDVGLAVRESQEDNNGICTPAPVLDLGPTDVDLVVTELSYSIADEWDRCTKELDYEVTVRNLGVTPAGGFWVGLYRSEDPVISRQDRLLDGIHVPQLEGLRTLRGQLHLPDEPPAAGEPHLGVLVDPDEVIREDREDNNWAATPWPVEELAGVCDFWGCPDDGFEVNDSPEQAARIAEGVQDRLCIGRPDGDDWYAVTLGPGDGLDVTIEYDPEDGDIGLELYDADAVRLFDRSAQVGGTQTVTLPFTPAQAVFLIRVRPLAPEVVNHYRMEVDIRPAPEQADVAVANVTANPQRLRRGQELVVSFDVENRGLAAVDDESWADLFRPGVDGILARHDVLPVPAIGPLSRVRLESRQVIDWPDGPERFQVWITADVPELDDADRRNNSGLSPFVEYLLPPAGCREVADEFEPNDLAWQALPPPDVPAPNGDRAISDGLTVCQGFDDWWAYELEAGDELVCDVTFQHGLGDIDLRLHGPDGELLDADDSRDPREEVSVRDAAEGRHLVHVHYFGGGGDEPWNVYRLRCRLAR